jgi:eukaryotic-like serine/threonine-protein kinase
MSELSPPVLPGFRYLEPVLGGSGGFGKVYLYEQQAPRRRMAVKVLKTGGADEAAVRAVLAEANAMAAVGEHPHLATVHLAAPATDGRPCIVMHYYGGPNLMTVASGGVLDVRRVVRIGIQMADVLKAAHDKRIVHRDIKPANILTDDHGNPRLTDFGIAGRIAPDGDAPSRQFAGSLLWCPPELLDGHPGSAASDIYSLGATLWHLLTGHSPVVVAGRPGRTADPQLNSVEAIEERIRHVTPPPTGRDDVPDSLERLLAHMLAKRPEARPASAAEVARELAHVEQQLGGPPPPGTGWYVDGSAERGAVSLPPQATETLLKDPTPTAPEPSGPSEPAHLTSYRSPWLIGAAAAVTVVILVGGALLVRQPWVDDPPQAPGAAEEVTDPDAQCVDCLGDNLPPGVPTVTATRVDADTVRFAWRYSNPRGSDSYRWRSDDGREDVTEEPEVELAVPAGDRVCVQVRVVRADGSHAAVDWSPEGCEGTT